jgi:hypothetical protein
LDKNISESKPEVGENLEGPNWGDWKVQRLDCSSQNMKRPMQKENMHLSWRRTMEPRSD